MRTTSRVLGIIGAAISILFGLFLILGGAAFMNSSIWESAYNSSDALNDIMTQSDYVEQNVTAGMVFLSFGMGSVAAGILGLVGGLIVTRKNMAAGVMMIIAAVLSLFTFFNLVSMTLFIIGSVMALKREPQFVMPPYYVYPPYPQYPQYPYPPQQPAPPMVNPPEPPRQ